MNPVLNFSSGKNKKLSPFLTLIFSPTVSPIHSASEVYPESTSCLPRSQPQVKRPPSFSWVKTTFPISGHCHQPCQPSVHLSPPQSKQMEESFWNIKLDYIFPLLETSKGLSLIQNEIQTPALGPQSPTWPGTCLSSSAHRSPHSLCSDHCPHTTKPISPVGPLFLLSSAKNTLVWDPHLTSSFSCFRFQLTWSPSQRTFPWLPQISLSAPPPIYLTLFMNTYYRPGVVIFISLHTCHVFLY